MKIIKFPGREPSNQSKFEQDKYHDTSKGEVIDFENVLSNSKLEPTEYCEADLDFDDSLFERIAKTASDICADEGDMAAAVCSIVDELNKKTAPLREKIFMPNKVFFKMVGNEHFEAKFTRIISRFPAMTEYKDLSLTQVAAMLSKAWPFTAEQRQVVDFTLHIMGAYPPVDLPKVNAYLSTADWQAVIDTMKSEKH